ncbi:MAG: carotenoid oxygenase family protein [Kofleriaceae bacterium]|nr:carotenoid oxygenase family protein [Kofleriaceae bacterium]MCB9572998.1 carotenoid oxygenase family protein [Kofleriaceae bacterium]
MAQPRPRDVPAVPADDVIVQRLWRTDLPREHGFTPLEVRGQLPAELRGTLWRNGPGLFGLFGRPYTHPFEGDGAITAVRLGDAATGAVRVTDTPGLRAERRAGRMLYGLGVPWLRRVRNALGARVKNTANTSVLVWQDRVLALMEAGRPVELDARELRTIGETDLGGVVGGAFSAHPHRVPARRATYNFGVAYGRHHRLRLYELPDVGAARVVAEVPLRYPAMLHDFVVTDRHAVWLIHPLALDLPRLLTGRGGFADVFRWQPDHASEVVAIPLDRPDEVVRFDVPHCWQWHFASARRRADHEVVVDYVRYPDASSLRGLSRGPTGDGFAPGTLHRAVIDLTARRLRTEPVAARACEFPRVHPDREAGAWRTVWVSLDDDRAVGAIDADTGAIDAWPLPAGHRGGEPVVVPRRGRDGERDVWILVQCYDGVADRSGVLIFDGARFPDDPVAEAWFDHRIPVTFHGVWQAEASA